MKIVLFNGPPRSGKDTAANMLAQYLNGIPGVTAIRYSFARPLKETTHALYGMSHLEYDTFEYSKDMISSDFFGLTPREAYIKVSEKMIKPVLGNTHWGKVFVNWANQLDDDKTVFIISDCGFQEEIEPIKDISGPMNMFMVKMSREGYDFSKDSRSYINDPSIPSMEITNNGNDLTGLAQSVILLGGILLSSLSVDIPEEVG